MMLSTLTIAAMLRLMDLLKLIDIVYVMTGGGPGHLSETVNLYNYLAALSYDKAGHSFWASRARTQLEALGATA